MKLLFKMLLTILVFVGCATKKDSPKEATQKSISSEETGKSSDKDSKQAKQHHRNQIASITAKPNGVLSRRGSAPASTPQKWKTVIDVKFPDLGRNYSNGLGWLKGNVPKSLAGNVIKEGYVLQIDLSNAFYVVEIGVEGNARLKVNGKAVMGSKKVFSKQAITNGKIVITKDQKFDIENKLTYLKAYTPEIEKIDNKPKTYIFKYE